MRNCTLPFLFLWIGATIGLLAAPVQAQTSSYTSSSGLSSSAPDTLELELVPAMQRALDRSPEIRQRGARRDRAEARYAEARATRFLPDARLQTAHSAAPGIDFPEGFDGDTQDLHLEEGVKNDWEDLRMLNRIEVDVTQPLWTGGELSGSIRAAERGIAVDEAAVEGQASEVALRFGESYYGLQLATALDRLTEEAEDVLRRAEREINRLFDEGDPEVEEADLFELELAKEELTRQTAEVRERRRTAQSAMTRQLFLEEGTVLEPVDRDLRPVSIDLSSGMLDDYIETGLANRSELDQARAGIEAREELVDVARARYFPRIGLRFSTSFTYTPGRFRQESPFVSDPFRGRGLRVGVGLQQNLNFFQTESRVDQAKAELREVEHQQEAAHQLVQFEVEEAFRNARIARETVESRDRSLTTTEEWVRTEQINFDLGVGDAENLIDAVRANLEAEAAYYEAVERYNVAVLRLLRKKGVLADRAQTGTLFDQ